MAGRYLGTFSFLFAWNVEERQVNSGEVMTREHSPERKKYASIDQRRNPTDTRVLPNES